MSGIIVGVLSPCADSMCLLSTSSSLKLLLHLLHWCVPGNPWNFITWSATNPIFLSVRLQTEHVQNSWRLPLYLRSLQSIEGGFSFVFVCGPLGLKRSVTPQPFVTIWLTVVWALLTSLPQLPQHRGAQVPQLGGPCIISLWEFRSGSPGALYPHLSHENICPDPLVF